MSDKNWKTVTNNKKKIKQEEPVKFDPIPSRQKQDLVQEQQKKTQELLEKQNLTNSNQNPNQNWETVILKKTQPKPKVTLQQREPSAVKVDELGDIIQTKKVSHQMSKSIIDARITKKWTQRDLANHSNVDIKLINEIEKGACLYDSNIFNKICKSLGVKIERTYDIV